MKKIINHKKIPIWLTVVTLSIIIATINIFHVILGLAKTPSGFTYTATGHYYLDYFEYLQYIASGMTGHWLPINHFSTDDMGISWRFFPYILLGKVAWILYLSPMTTYWVAIFFLTVFTIIGFYLIINLMLNKEASHIKIIALLIAVFSGPVYKILIGNGQLILNAFDFWYGPTNFLRRFEVIPYHALGLFLLLIILFKINKFWSLIPSLSKKAVIIKSLWIAALSIALMTFSPIPLASLLPALLIISTVRFIKYKNDRLKIFLFNVILFILIIPAVLILRNSPGYSGWNIEVKWIGYNPWWFFLLNIGPVVLFFPFGLWNYLKENNFLRQILLTFTLVSFGLYISPLAYYLGIHNLRFFSSVSYICYGVLTVIGIKKISSLFKKYHKIAVIFISSILILYSLFLTAYFLYIRASGLDASNPETVLTYLPESYITGLQLLSRYPQTNVLTGPYGQIGLLVPVFSYKKVFVAREISTNDIEKKRAVSDLFYSNRMTENKAKNFLKTNKFGFVILTPLDGYSPNNIDHYQFLKQIYNKESVIIWKVIN